MTAPFTTAKMFGYTSDQIIKFLMKQVPGLDKKIEQALAAGYTTDQVINFLKNQGGESPKARKRIEEEYSRPFTDEQGRLTETQRQEKGSKRAKKQDFLTQTLDPKRTLSTVAGAGIGYATGGPVGAVTGAMGGSEAYDDLIRRYEQHKAEGGTLGLKDFIASIAKGGAKAAGATALVNTAKDFLSTLGEAPQDEEQAQAPTPPVEGSEQEAPAEVEQIEEVTEKVISPEEAKKSYEVLARSGIGGLLERIEQDLSPIDAMKLTRKMYGDQSIKDIERERKKPFEEVFEEWRDYLRQGQKAEVQEQPEEEVAEPLEAQDTTQVQWSQVEEPRAFSFNELFKGGEERGETQLKGRAQPFESAMKSSNLSAATFDPDSSKMRILFRAKEGGKGGTVYEYENMDEETFNQMTGGEAKPVTEGSNKFGVWFNTKNPSIGATFSKFIKKNPEKFPYKKVEPDSYSLEEKQIVNADRAHLASELFEPFAQKRKEGRQKARAQGLKDIVPALKAMDDQFLFDVVEYLEEKLQGKLKNEPTVKRLGKEFEKEFMR